jgi:2-polyprenyl-3-methyl-5-hydroxy-6-metoxy-1,4-benzoquinol methylase
MWMHAVPWIVCPRCRESLACTVIEGDGHVHEPLPSGANPATGSQRWIERGVLTCDACRCFYPIHRAVPILLRYKTAMGESAYSDWPHSLRRKLNESGFGFPADKPPKGEEFVAASFSTEWQTYDYGATLWTASTADRLQTFRGECGLKDGDLAGKRFCEIGCGLGILTNEAAAKLGADAWGMDLSTSVFRAVAQFRDNPHLHFVQASVFSAPFKPEHFDFVYSHGVLHHTWSTKEAVLRAAELVSRGGTLYVWLYGYDDVRVSLPRRLAFALEQKTRPVIARLPPRVATAVLWPLVPVYQVASFLGRLSGTHGTMYSPQQAIHAARDRFTPLYAHRHEFSEVASWYEQIGLQGLHKVKASEVPPSWALAIERNVSIRGQR